MSYEEQKDVIQKYINESLFSIHLIDTHDDTNQEFINLQYNLAKRNCAGPNFKCIIGIDEIDFRNELFRDIEETKISNPNIIKVPGWDKNDIIDNLNRLIIDKDKRLEELERNRKPIKNVFLLYDTRDRNNTLRQEIKTKLEETYKIDVSQPITSKYEEEGFNIRTFEKNELRKCDGVILLYGLAEEGWYISRQSTVIEEKKNTKAKAVCVDEPHKIRKIRNDVRRNEFMVINEENSIEERIQDFINELYIQ